MPKYCRLCPRTRKTRFAKVRHTVHPRARLLQAILTRAPRNIVHISHTGRRVNTAGAFRCPLLTRSARGIVAVSARRVPGAVLQVAAPHLAARFVILITVSLISISRSTHLLAITRRALFAGRCAAVATDAPAHADLVADTGGASLLTGALQRVDGAGRTSRVPGQAVHVVPTGGIPARTRRVVALVEAAVIQIRVWRGVVGRSRRMCVAHVVSTPLTLAGSATRAEVSFVALAPLDIVLVTSTDRSVTSRKYPAARACGPTPHSYFHALHHMHHQFGRRSGWKTATCQSLRASRLHHRMPSRSTRTTGRGWSYNSGRAFRCTHQL
jgi:hypothetical protein